MSKKKTNSLLFIALLFALFYNTLYPQSPESYFPSQVGNVWRYQDFSKSNWLDWQITRDSLTKDGSRYLFNGDTPVYRIDTSLNVYSVSEIGFENLLYKLTTDLDKYWVVDSGGNPNEYGWLVSIDTGQVFGVSTSIKKFRYSNLPPDSGGQDYYDSEIYLASNFGLIWHWEEPGDVTYLTGCKIGNDTFGSITSVSNNIANIPHSNQLFQNYPNPFNPVTQIQYQLPVNCFVTLKVFDVVGREVLTLVNEEQPAGYKSVEFNGSKLPSGVYVYKLTAGSFEETKKMVLLK